MTKLDLYRVDPDELLERSGVDYLFVAFHPPADAPGKRFEYPMAVRSKRDGVRCKLDSGPSGLNVTDAGRVTWNVPADFPDPETAVTQTATDATGRPATLSFRVVVRSKP